MGEKASTQGRRKGEREECEKKASAVSASGRRARA